MTALRLLTLALLPLAACSGSGPAQANQAAAQESGRPFQTEVLGQFNEPWAMTFLPGERQALVTEKSGRLLLWTRAETPGANATAVVEVAGVPAVAYGGQGGLGDVVLHPDFASNRIVYLSYAEAEGGNRGAAIGRGRLVLDGASARLDGFEVIWRQVPKFSGRGHYGHRIAFSPDGRFMFVSSGERQQFTPAQDMASNAGKVLRLNPDGSVPADNPFADRGGVTAQIWSLGHRNPLGIAFDSAGRLWEIEMGPEGGDELNIVERGANYGYPIVSNGDHYDGRVIPDHDTRPEFTAPRVWWTPVISPGDMIIYSGSMFPQWRGDALIASLSGQALVRVDIDGTNAREAERFAMGARMREIEQTSDGAIYMLEDGANGRLLRLTPAG